MARGFLSVPIMRPNPCRTVLHVSILAVLVLTLNADSEDSKCETTLKVRRNTVYEAFVGHELRINCTLTFCNNSPPTVSWYKRGKPDVLVNVSNNSHIRTEWNKFSLSEGILVLIFKKILSSDAGEYQCKNEGNVGHAISVTVHDNGEFTTATWNNNTNITPSPAEDIENLWMYVYSVAGIAAFVFLVIIISVILMRGCKGKSKKETQTERQYIEIPMVEQPSTHASVQPRGSPSAPLSRRSTRKNPPPAQPNEITLSRDNECVYSKTAEDRERQRNEGLEEEGSSVVYAALNHQVPPRAAARPRIIQEECSEYAAIRVC